MSAIPERAAAWLLAYAIHSTLLLGAAALVTARLRDHGWRDALWRAALVGGVLTVTVQALAGHTPSLGGWSPAAAVRAAPSADLQSTASPATRARSVDASTASPSSVRSAGEADAGTTASTGDGVATKGGVVSGDLASGDARASGDRLASGDGAAPGGSAPRAFASVDWVLVALGAWALGAMLLLMRLVIRQVALHRVLGPRAPVDDPQLAEALGGLCAAAGLRRAPRLTESERCPTPLALGMREICIPRRFRELPAEERRAALAHELAHVARHDPLWHLGAGIAEALFFFQPLQRVARRRLRESAEYLSDDWAVRQTGSPLGLARCLVEVAAWLKGADPVPQGVLAMAEGGPVLSRRVERLVRQDNPAAPLSPVRRIAAALLLLVPVAALAPGAASSAVAAASRSEGLGPLPPLPPLPPLGPMRQVQAIVRHPDPSRPLAERIDWARELLRNR